MGNCQAIDNASLVIQYPCGKADKLYCPVSAAEIMKLNPGHCVALLLTTTIYSSAAAASGTAAGSATKNNTTAKDNKIPLRVTRIKLLRPTDTLVLGHVYRLVTNQEVIKGLKEKKHAMMKLKQVGLSENYEKTGAENQNSDFKALADVEKIKQLKHERHRSRNNTPVNSAAASKSRAWQPSLKSISEAAS